MVLDVGDGEFQDDHWQVRGYCERSEHRASNEGR
jgi:hypothetical protein